MIKSVAKAIGILNAFTPSEPRLTLTEIARRQGLPRGTTHNLLGTLLSYGFVEKVDAEQYALGTAIIALTQAVRVNAELRDRAAPLLRELADACRESVYLTVLDGDYSLYIYAVESPQRLRARTAVGDRAHLHCTGVGKATLSRLSKEQVEAIVARVGLPRYTPMTITDLQALHEELQRTRERGYSIDQGEHEVGSHCVGAPILDERGRVVGACSISSGSPDIIHGQLPEFSSRVVHVADEISRRMGYVRPTQGSITARSLRGVRY